MVMIIETFEPIILFMNVMIYEYLYHHENAHTKYPRPKLIE